MIRVTQVQKGDLRDFIALPSTLYRKDPRFVPELNRDLRMQFSDANPFVRHSRMRFFLATVNGRPAGRIVSFINEKHNALHSEKAGFFGFFESVHDTAISSALLETAASHVRDEGMKVMRGPMNFSTNEECGFLSEGFTDPPMLMTPYNPPCYNDMAISFGMKKVKELFAYISEIPSSLPDKIMRVASLSEKKGITVRPLDMKIFQQEMAHFKELYNSAWEDNWGFIPLDDQELSYMSGRLRQVIVPDLCALAFHEGKPVGFMGILPDFNQVLRKMNGRLNPFTIAKALFFSRKIRDLRLLLLGIRKDYRNRGVDALLFREGFVSARKRRFRRIEFSWILEDNIPVQRLVEMIGGRLYKRYSIYEKEL